MQNKMYYRHSMYQGGLKVTSAQDMLNTKPERMIEFAIHGMLPKNRLGDSMKTSLKYTLVQSIHTKHNNQKFGNFAV